MSTSNIIIPDIPYIYGGDLSALCGECQLPCKLEETSHDCLRRFFLQGMVQCSYFVFGYCFLIDVPGCVFDNGGQHEYYWMRLLNDYFHNVKEVQSTDPEFIRHSNELKQLVAEQLQSRTVSLCRYIEECYNRVMETGGGMSEEMMEKLDESYLALLSGTPRKE